MLRTKDNNAKIRDDDIINICPICRKNKASKQTRKDVNGAHWCKKCQDAFDNIDWDADK